MTQEYSKCRMRRKAEENINHMQMQEVSPK